MTGIGIVITLLPTRSEEKGVLGVGSIPVAILPSCRGKENIELYLQKHKYSWVVKLRNISEAVLRPPYTPLEIILTAALWAMFRILAKGSIVALKLPPLCFLQLITETFCNSI